jgi:hypothetical protein
MRGKSFGKRWAIKALLNRSDFDPPMGRKVSGSASSRGVGCAMCGGGRPISSPAALPGNDSCDPCLASPHTPTATFLVREAAANVPGP